MNEEDAGGRLTNAASHQELVAPTENSDRYAKRTRRDSTDRLQYELAPRELGLDPNPRGLLTMNPSLWKGEGGPLWKGPKGGDGGTCTLGVMAGNPGPTLCRPQILRVPLCGALFRLRCHSDICRDK